MNRELIAGRRVRVSYPSPTLRGLHGVVVELAELDRIGDGDYAVLLDKWDHPLGFYRDELILEGLA